MIRVTPFLFAAITVTGTIVFGDDGHAKLKTEAKARSKENTMDGSGNQAKQAAPVPLFAETIAAIRARKAKPALVIPFRALGPRWDIWKKRRPDRDTIGISRDGFFFVDGHGGRYCFDADGMEVTPTGDGSILAIRTFGLPLNYINGIVFQSDKDETLYFGVIHGIGLVHLHGKGTVTTPDGKITPLGAIPVGKKPAR